MKSGPWCLLPLAACVSEAQVAADMERALATANDAVAASLVATEVRMHARETPDVLRHATDCGCPCRTRVGEPPTFVLELDYHDEGCLPASGLLGTGLAGQLVLEVDAAAVEATLDGGALAARPLAGELDGDVTADAVVSRGAFTIGARSFRTAVRAQFDADGFSVDGTVRVDGVEVALDGVRISPAGLAARCPTPQAGTAQVDLGPTVEVDYGEPGDGSATVTRKGRESAPTGVCARASPLL